MSLESWKMFFEFGGAVLLFLTFIFGTGVVITSTRISTRQAEQLRQFDKSLTDAKIELGRQQERTANADARVAGLEADAANAKSEMAKQQTRAANAERALLELQQRLAHRRINQSDHDRLVVSLRPFRGSVVQLTKLGDAEAAQFADDVLTILRDAGWSVHLSIVGMVAPPQYGLVCTVDTSTPAGKAIAAALHTLPTAEVRSGNLPQGIVGNILVGLKPPA
jgi:predicted negative regulator of RcsB-dependent stress response